MQSAPWSCATCFLGPPKLCSLYLLSVRWAWQCLLGALCCTHRVAFGLNTVVPCVPRRLTWSPESSAPHPPLPATPSPSLASQPGRRTPCTAQQAYLQASRSPRVLLRWLQPAQLRVLGARASASLQQPRACHSLRSTWVVLQPQGRLDCCS